jgi:hypothetical protein
VADDSLFSAIASWFLRHPTCFCHHASERASESKGIGEIGKLLGDTERVQEHASVCRKRGLDMALLVIKESNKVKRFSI